VKDSRLKVMEVPAPETKGDQMVSFDGLKRALSEVLPGPEYFAELLDIMKEIRDQKVRTLKGEIERLQTLREDGGRAHARTRDETRAPIEKGDKDDRDMLEHYHAILAQRRFPEWRSKCKFSYIEKDICDTQERVICHLVGGDLKNSAGAARDLARRFGHPGQKDAKMKVGEIITQQLQGDQELWHLVSKPRATENKFANPGGFYKNHLSALIALKDKVKEQQLTRIAITKLGANKNRVAWKFTMRKLQEIFADIEVTFVVHSFISKSVHRGRGAAMSAQANKKDDSGRMRTGKGHSSVASGSADGGCPMQPLSQKHPLGKPTTNRYGHLENMEDNMLTDQCTSTEPTYDQTRGSPGETRGDGGEVKEETPTTVQGLADGGCPKQPLSSKHPLGEPSPPRYEIIESEKKRLLIDTTTVSSDPESTTEVETVRTETKKDERGTEVKPTAVQGLADGGCPKQPLSPKHPLGEPSPLRYETNEREKDRLLIDISGSSELESTTEIETAPAETRKDAGGTEVELTAVQGLVGGGSPVKLPLPKTNTPPRQTLPQKVNSGKVGEQVSNQSMPSESESNAETTVHFLAELGKMRKSLQAMESSIMIATPTPPKEKPKSIGTMKTAGAKPAYQRLISHPMMLQSNRRIAK
jgi:hypothetical protein